MKYTRFFPVLAALLLLFVASCSTEADITAEPKDLYVVYGVLNPNDSVQYIRIERGFLVDGSAIVVAQDSDLSVRGLTVTMEAIDVINNKPYTYTGVEVPVKKDSGLFKQDGYAYKFSIPLKTNGGNNPRRLKGGYPVTLTITRPGDEDFRLTSQTTIPQDLNITSPTNEIEGPPASVELLPLHQDVKIEFVRKLGAGSGAYAFELRMGMAYTRNGTPDTLTWNYGGLQRSSVCSLDGQTGMCFEAADGSVIRSFLTQLAPYAGQDLRIDDRFTKQPVKGNYARSCWLDVTAVDTALSKYLIVNNPAIAELNQVKPEFSNIAGTDNGEAVLAYGIFGAINAQRRYVGITDCVKYLLGLRNLSGVPTPQPVDACNLP